MDRPRFSITDKLLALWLALALAWPSPAFALRPRAGGLEEHSPVTEDLAQQLAPASRTAGLEETPPAVVQEVMTWVEEWGRQFGAPAYIGVVTPQALTARIAERTGRTAPENLHWRRALQWRLEQFQAHLGSGGNPVERLPAVEGSFAGQTRRKIEKLVAEPLFTQAQATHRLASWDDHPLSFGKDPRLESLIADRKNVPRLWIFGSFVGYAAPTSDVDLALYEPDDDPWPEVSPWRNVELASPSAEEPISLRSGTLYLPADRDAPPHWLEVAISDVFRHGGESGWRLNGVRLAELYSRHHAIRDELRMAAEAADPSPLERPLVFQATARLRQQLSAGLEEPADPGDPTLRRGSGQAAAPDPKTATAADVADYLTQQWGVPVRKDGDDYVVDQTSIPEASWTFHAIRDHEPGRIIEDMSALPVRTWRYPLWTLPTFSTPGNSSAGVYLGFIEGIDHPVIVKAFDVLRAAGDVQYEVVSAQIFDRQGISPRVYGMTRLTDGLAGYVMQLAPGKLLVWWDAPWVQAFRSRALQAGMSYSSLVRTPSGRYVTIDAGNATTYFFDRRQAWIIAQNAGWTIHELKVKAITITARGRAYLLSNAAALAALALLKVPADTVLPVIAMVTPTEHERLRAIARQGGFSDDAITEWENRYLLMYQPEGLADIRWATVEATRRLANRLGVETVAPTAVSSLPDALEAFRGEFLKLLGGFGLTIQTGTLGDEAMQDLYRAAQA